MNTLKQPSSPSAAKSLESVETTESLPFLQPKITMSGGGTRFVFKKVLLYFAAAVSVFVMGLGCLYYTPDLCKFWFGPSSSLDYDIARETCNDVTGTTLVISLLMATHYLRTRTAVTKWVVLKAAALILIVPGSVYMAGNYMINNFGGLISGL